MARGQPQGEEVYRPEVQPEDLPRKITPEIHDVGQVGTAISHLGDVVQAKFHADSATWAGDQIGKTRSKATQDLSSAWDALPAGEDPGNFAEKYMASFAKNTQGLADSAGGNPIARGMVEKGLAELQDTLFQKAKELEATGRVAYRTDAFKSYVKSQSDVIEAHPELLLSAGSTGTDMANAIGGDPRNRLGLMRDMHAQFSVAAANGLARQAPRGVLDALNDPEHAPPLFDALAGLNDGQREAIRAKANEKLAGPVYSFLESGDTRSAQHYLERNKDVLDPKTSWALSRTIDAQVKEKQNEAKQDIADRYQDSVKAAAFGLPNAKQVTDSELRVLFPKDAQRHIDGLNMLQAAGAQARQYDKMTPEDIAADVNKAEPKTGGPEAAFAIEGYEMRRRAAEQSIQARQHDPAQFAISNGAWELLDLKNPDRMVLQLRTRANTQEQLSEQTGVNTPLMSKPEQQAVTGWLAAQAPKDRIQSLTAIRQSVPTDRAYGAFMHQIAPSSPLTALSGTLLDKPTSASTPAWYDPKYVASPVIGQRILEGEQILEAKGEPGKLKASFPMPRDPDLQPAFQAAVGGPYSDLFRGRDQTLSTYLDAFKSVYAAQASHLGITNGIINNSVAQWAARQVIGNVTQYGHTTLSVPSGMDPTRFEGIADAATHVALKAAGYSPDDIKALRGYGLRELGDTLGTGVYMIIDGNGDPLKGKSGRDSVKIDVNQQFSRGQALPEPTIPEPELARMGTG